MADGFHVYARRRFGIGRTQWGWRLVVNGRIVATDGNQGYENRSEAETMGWRVVTGEFHPDTWFSAHVDQSNQVDLGQDDPPFGAWTQGEPR